MRFFSAGVGEGSAAGVGEGSALRLPRSAAPVDSTPTGEPLRDCESRRTRLARRGPDAPESSATPSHGDCLGVTAGDVTVGNVAADRSVRVWTCRSSRRVASFAAHFAGISGRPSAPGRPRRFLGGGAGPTLRMFSRRTAGSTVEPS